MSHTEVELKIIALDFASSLNNNYHWLTFMTPRLPYCGVTMRSM
jgi:hypothetical protein